MNKTVIKLCLLVFTICLFFSGCENVINGTTTLKVKNDSGASQTFSVYTSFTDKTLVTPTIANSVTESFIVPRGYYKTRPKNCKWVYESGTDTWIIKAQEKINVIAINKLPINVTLKNNGNTSFSQDLVKDGESKTFSIYPDEKYFANKSPWFLDGEATETDTKRRYVMDTSIPPVKIYFQIVISGDTIEIQIQK